MTTDPQAQLAVRGRTFSPQNVPRVTSAAIAHST